MRRPAAQVAALLAVTILLIAPCEAARAQGQIIHVPGDQPTISAATAVAYPGDEFYKADIGGRGLPIVAQDCGGEACIEPLLRTLSRFDRILGEHFGLATRSP